MLNQSVNRLKKSKSVLISEYRSTSSKKSQANPNSSLYRLDSKAKYDQSSTKYSEEARAGPLQQTRPTELEYGLQSRRDEYKQSKLDLKKSLHREPIHSEIMSSISGQSQIYIPKKDGYYASFVAEYLKHRPVIDA